MAERSLRVLKGETPAGEEAREPSNAHSTPAHVLPHPLLPLQPPVWLRGRILATLRALDEEMHAPGPALDPLIPPAALKHRILEKLATHGDASEPIPAPVGSTVHRRALRRGAPGNAGHPVSKKERAGPALRHRPKWSFSADQALAFTHALASGAALILLVFLGVSTVRLVRTQEQVTASHRATQEARKRTELLRRSTAGIQQLAELQTRTQLQQAPPQEDMSLTELVNGCGRLWRSNEALRRELEETEREQRRMKLLEQHSDQMATASHRARMEAVRSAEELQRKLNHNRAQLSSLQGALSAMVTDLK